MMTPTYASQSETHPPNLGGLKRSVDVRDAPCPSRLTEGLCSSSSLWGPGPGTEQPPVLTSPPPLPVPGALQCILPSRAPSEICWPVTQSIFLNVFCLGRRVSGKEKSREKTRTRGQPGRDHQPAARGSALREPAAGSQLLGAPPRGPRSLEGHDPGPAGADPPVSEAASPGEAGACPAPRPAPSPHAHAPLCSTCLLPAFLPRIALPGSCPQGSYLLAGRIILRVCDVA